MADKDKDIDVLFRKKLAEHAEEPTPLAWGKLEVKLSRERKGIVPWRGMAASLLLGAGVVGLLYFSIQSTEKELTMIAQKGAVPETKADMETDIEPLPEKQPELQNEDAPINKPAVKAEPGPINQTVSEDLGVSEPSAEVDESPNETTPPIEVEILELAPLNTDLLVAQNGLVGEEVQEVAYTITIISNGLIQAPGKENLVNEIENRIDQLSGLLTKVDKGFAGLQDAKNGLFASITSRKENNNN
jgi:hypothetical protein